MSIDDVLELAGIQWEEVENLRFSSKRKRAILLLMDGVKLHIEWNSMRQLIKKEVL